jgi:hypothetical protein
MLGAVQAGLLGSAPDKQSFVFAQLDAHNSSYVSLTVGNTRVTKTGGAGWYGARTNQGKNSGKWYFEVSCGVSAEVLFGFAKGTYNFTDTAKDNIHLTPLAFCMDFRSSNRWYNGSYQTVLQTVGPNGLLSVKADLDQGKIYISANGAAYDSDSLNPISLGTDLWFPCAVVYTPTVYAAFNFGSSPFSQSVPAGYNAGWYE